MTVLYTERVPPAQNPKRLGLVVMKGQRCKGEPEVVFLGRMRDLSTANSETRAHIGF